MESNRRVCLEPRNVEHEVVLKLITIQPSIEFGTKLAFQTNWINLKRVKADVYEEACVRTVHGGEKYASTKNYQDYLG